jgi:hypothetical protein
VTSTSTTITLECAWSGVLVTLWCLFLKFVHLNLVIMWLKTQAKRRKM